MKSEISNDVPKENILDSLENNITSNLNSLGMYVNYNSDKLDEHLDKNDKSLNKAMKLAQVDLVLTIFLAGLVIAYILLAP